ncbi:MAG: 50S ribosomal protein L29 [Bacteroidales bacterium]|nr:50S ribosomal protein L29 [Bacteroidales bacterium]
MKNSEIRELSTKEIVETIEEQKVKLYNLRATHAVSNLEQTHLLKSTKRLIARLKTQLTKRMAEEQKQNS